MIEKTKLKSNITLVTEKLPYVDSISLGVFVKAGAVDEKKEFSGISHFVEHMMFKGTKDRSARKIAENVDKIGGNINAFTSKECTCYYIKTIKDKIFDGANIIVDMLTNSIFDEEEVKRERNVIIEEIKMNEDAPDQVAEEGLMDMVLKGNNLGKSILGTRESLKDIKGTDLKKYVSDFYTKDKIVISAVGNFDKDKLVSYFENKFESLNDRQKDFEIYNRGYEKNSEVIVKDISQSHLAMGTPSIDFCDSRHYDLAVLNSILGGSMSSRLFQNIREEKGLAYSVYSGNHGFATGGYFNIYAGVSHDKVLDTIEAIHHELDELKLKGVTKEEFESALVQLKSNYIYSQENISSRMFRNGKYMLFTGRVKEQKEVIEIFDNMKIDAVNNVKDIISDFNTYSAYLVTGKDIDIKEVI